MSYVALVVGVDRDILSCQDSGGWITYQELENS